MSTGVSKFFREQWLDGAFDLIKPPGLTLEGLLAKARAGHMTNGYRNGVWLVEIPSLGWKTRIVTLKGGERLSLGFKPRVEGEEPRKTQAQVEVPSRDALPYAGSVWAVLYHRDVLLEDEVVLEPETLQLVTVLANPDWRQVPMNPETLLANHYKLDGGTSTQMSAEEFEKKLRESLLYWRDKAMAYVPKADPQATKPLIDQMVDRFLGWKLPEDFSPDGGISFKPTFNEGTPFEMRHDPCGTNLFHAGQAKAMLEHVAAPALELCRAWEKRLAPPKACDCLYETCTCEVK